MKEIIFFIITFLIVYLIYYIFVIRKKKALEKWQNGKEMSYLKKVYKIKIVNIKQMANVVAIANALIVATTVSIVSLFNNFISQMLMGFVILMGLILLIYHIIGRYYQKVSQNTKTKYHKSQK